MYIVLELMQGGELLDQMVDSHAFSEREAAEIMYTVVKTVNFLHQEGVGMGGARRRAGESRRKGGMEGREGRAGRRRVGRSGEGESRSQEKGQGGKGELMQGGELLDQMVDSTRLASERQLRSCTLS